MHACSWQNTPSSVTVTNYGWPGRLNVCLVLQTIVQNYKYYFNKSKPGDSDHAAGVRPEKEERTDGVR